LKRLEAEEGVVRARLKIFLGMSAGVGKTYAMLREAGQLRARGVDLVIGHVEAHGRPETDALLEGLERVPARKLEHRGVALEEMDLDAVLARRPAIALVDELAHSNAPGSRHQKRYEDVFELLEAGISVWTTVNIQHLESMADSVELLTLVPVRERVPDSVFDRADDLQLIDLPPDELIERLEAGKVYTGDASREAVSNFFSRDNLSVLREIALRQASMIAGRGLASEDSGAVSTQRILVAVSHSPHGEALLRWSRRLAYALKADLACLHVDSGLGYSEEERERLAANLKLAKDLGAEVIEAANADVVAGIVEQARAGGFSIIVAGKSGLSRSRGLFARRSLTERIIAGSGSIPVFSVQERSLVEPLRVHAARRLAASAPWQYLAAAASVAAATLVTLPLADFLGYRVASIPYLALIGLLALVLDRRPVLFAALLSALSWDFLFIPPRFTFVVASTEDLLMLALYFVVAATSGLATGKLKANERMLAVRESRMRLMGELASSLAGTAGLDAILGRAEVFFRRAFDAQPLFILADDEGELEDAPRGGRALLGEKELSAARYAFAKGRSAGRYTTTLSVIPWHFVPLEGPEGRVGVVGLNPPEGRAWSEDHESWLRTLARTLSLAIGRERLSEQAALVELAQRSERLGSILIDSVSHELRTPIAIIQGSASALTDEDTAADPVARAALVDEIVGGARRLDGLVENLLSMSRLESGQLALKLCSCDPEDLAASAIAAAEGELKDAPIGIEIEGGSAEGPGEAWCDEGLVVQVLANLLRNCARHAGSSPRIVLALGRATGPGREGGSRFAVRDDGPGVPEAELPLVFDKFHRVVPGRSGGTGLGLSICRGIVLAHGGAIEARNLPGSGLEVSFELPARPAVGG
jgi:two-component system sensor histidine kinase KdpD